MMNYGNQRNAIAQALMNVRNPQPRTQMPQQMAPMPPQLPSGAPSPLQAVQAQMGGNSFGMGMRQPQMPMPIGPPAPPAIAPQAPMTPQPPMDNSMGTLPQDQAMYPSMGG